mgnify:FL=1
MITGHDPGEWPLRVTAVEPLLSFAGGDQWVKPRRPDTQVLQPPAETTNPAEAGFLCDQSRPLPAPTGRREACDGQAEQGKGAG